MARVFTVHTPLGPETLKFHLLTGQETLSRPFDFELSMLSPSPALAMDSLLGKGVTIEVETQGQGRRYLHGEVARFTLIGRHGRYYRYTARVVPWLWYLTRAADFRIFQNKSVPQILDEVFAAYPYPLEKRLTGHYREWEYCVQYHETDFNFVSRLMEHEGIYYFFEHAMGQLKLVLADSIGAHASLPGHASIPYISPDAATIADEEHVRSWMVSKEVTSGGYITDDYDFKRPHAELRQWKIDPKGHPNADWRTYDFPGGYTELGDGQNYTKLRLEELQSPHELLQGDTTVRALAPGYLFSLYRCPRADQNREYLVVSASYYLKDNPYESLDAEEGTVWQIGFACQESTVQYRPPRLTPKPLASGPESAVVVGPPGEEIYTDEYGRVKVQFHWDQYGKHDENSSCWMRVAQPIAGRRWGTSFLPRIGQEVLVGYLAADPDYPVVTGGVYNADQRPPYLGAGLDPKQKHNPALSGFKSNTTKGGSGFNELRFDDTAKKEQVFLNAQRNLDVRVANNRQESVGASRSLSVGGSRTESVGGSTNIKVGANHVESIGGCMELGIEKDQDVWVGGTQKVTVDGDHEETIGGERKEDVTGNVSLQVGKSVDTKVAMNSATEAGMSLELRAGMELIVEAGMQLTLKGPGGFVTIGPAGVTIQGIMVLINSGGVAGTAKGAKPSKPKKAKKAKPGGPTPADQSVSGSKSS